MSSSPSATSDGTTSSSSSVSSGSSGDTSLSSVSETSSSPSSPPVPPSPPPSSSSVIPTEPPPTTPTPSPPTPSPPVSDSSSPTPSSEATPSITPSLPSQSPSSSVSLTTTILSSSSTSVWESASVATSSDGQVYTTLVQVTTVLAPGTLITTAPDNSSDKGSNTGAIVGGVVGGVGGLALILVAVFFFLRRRRPNDDFDGNFDPARVVSGRPGGGGGTLPQIDLDNEDDGMGGRLASTGIGGGIVTPFTYTPPSNEMSHVGGTTPLLAGAGVGAYAADTYGRRTSPPTSPGMQTQFTSSDTPYPASTTTGSSGYYGPNPYSPPLGRGHSPGPSMGTIQTGPPTSSSSEHGSGGALGAIYNPQSSKEREAYERYGIGRSHVANPDEPSGSYGAGVPAEAHRAYLQGGPSKSMSGPEDAAGSSVIVHQDGGRLDLGTPSREEPQQEIPPTYDSLPHEDRR